MRKISVLIIFFLSSFAVNANEDIHADRFQQFQTEGIKLLQARDYTNALKNFAAAVKEHSDSWQTWLNVGVCHLRLGDYNAAIADLQKSIKLGGLHAPQCITMSGAYEGLGDPQKALAWLEMACSVEPNQAENPAIQDKLKLLQDPMHRPPGKADDPDYMAGLIANQKWHIEDFPMKVYVRKNIELPEFHAEFDLMVRDTLDQWCKATDNLVKYKFVDDKESANLIFDYTERREQVSPEHDPGIEGNSETRCRFDDHSTDWSNITVLVKDSPKAASYRKPYAIKKVLLHEIGHALGIHGHSPNPEDMMFSAATPIPFAVLSKRDVNTIRRIYALPPSDPQVQALDYIKEKNFEKAAACFTIALKEQPNSWQLLKNIGNCYMELGRYNDAIEYLEKSVRQGELHHVSQCLSLAVAYQKIGKASEAWEWLDIACQIDPAQAADPKVQEWMKKLSYPINHPAGSTSSADYLSSVFKTNKWQFGSMPLKAYIQPNSKLRSFHSDFEALAKNSMDQWCQATSGAVSYKLVDKPESANLLWTYTDNEDECAAVCELGLDGATDLKVRAIDDKPELATIAVLVKDKPIGPFRSRQVLAKICLHEMGHALGMNGHSPNAYDVMYTSGNADGKLTLSERDKNTIKKLYPKADEQ